MIQPNSSCAGLLLICTLLIPSAVLAQASSIGTAETETILALNSFSQNNYLLDGAPIGSDLVPASLISLNDSIENIVWVEMEKGLLHLMAPNQNTGQWQVGFTRSISIGKAGYGKEVEGDNRTPVGLYRVTSFLPDEELTDYYGIGAFPINYPNSYDRLKNRTGYGIWLHGLPKGVDERPLLDSEGCVIIDNTAFDWLRSYVTEGQTRVLLGDQIRWTSGSEVALVRGELESTLEEWRSAWAAIDNPTYLDFYADDFSSFDKNLQEWISYKNRIHALKDWVEVDVSELNIFAYPGESDLVVTEYHQVYKSSNFNAVGEKQIFWRRQADGSWKIIFEGAA